MISDSQRQQLINFLKSLTRLVVQANLYSAGHPQVKDAAVETINNLNAIAQDQNSSELSLIFEQGKLLINGLPFLAADRVPNSLANLFKKASCDTITFNKAVSLDELIAFPKIMSAKSSAEEFLKNNSIVNISLKKSIYEKVDKPRDKEISEEVSAKANVSQEISGRSFEDSLKTIVSKITADENEQQKIVNALFEKFKAEVESRINVAMEQFKKEKNKLENDFGRTEAVISNLANGELTVDKNGNIIMMNPQAQSITGKPLKEVAGKKIFDVANIENQILNIAKELKSETEEKLNKEVSVKGNDGLAKTIKNSTAIIKNEEGKIVGTISLPTDMARLKEIDQLKEDFVATMTHELRSPLTSIKMALDLISREKINNPSVVNMINAAIRNSERLNSIISDILDFSKLQSGKMTFNLLDLNPKLPVEGAIEAMKPWASSKNVAVSAVFEEDLPFIYADKRRTEQVIINLLSNSLKFTPSAGKIDISVFRGRDSMANFVFFSIKDSGCGIKKEEIGKIFDKFVQAVSGEKVGGTGLGLAITKAMVVMQGGNISVQSEYGQGAVFTFSIPIYRGGEQNKENIEVKPEKPWWKKLFSID